MLFLKKGKEDVLDLHPRHTDKNALHVALLTKQNGRIWRPAHQKKQYLFKANDVYVLQRSHERLDSLF